MFTKMDHAAVCVSDMARSIAFYRDALGFEQVFDRVFDEGMARILGVPVAEARIVHMRLGDGVVELFDYRTPPGQPREAAPQWAYGVTHIGLRVEGFWPAYEALRARGVPFLGEPTEIRPQVWVAYFCGPDGEVLEMRELP
jgi:catechol 2,3-dioxygenase-like lactoylglutathione lyase family enzyme